MDRLLPRVLPTIAMGILPLLRRVTGKA